MPPPRLLYSDKQPLRHRLRARPYTVGFRNTILPATPGEIDDDPRGFIWMWEAPDPSARYFIGGDPSVGITGWTRETRTGEDHKTDNAVAQVIKYGPGATRDVQVAEFAAPCDPEDFAAVLNFLGRMYSGRDADAFNGQAQIIVEVYPGPGLLTLRRLLNEFHYDNLWRWEYLDSYVPEKKSNFGWHSGPKSRRDLWLRCSRHLKRNQILMHSPALIEEIVSSRYDPSRMTARAGSHAHDDRWMALFLAIWAAHDWSPNVDSEYQETTHLTHQPEWAATHLSADEQKERWEEAFQELLSANPADDLYY